MTQYAYEDCDRAEREREKRSNEHEMHLLYDKARALAARLRDIADAVEDCDGMSGLADELSTLAPELRGLGLDLNHQWVVCGEEGE